MPVSDGAGFSGFSSFLNTGILLFASLQIQAIMFGNSVGVRRWDRTSGSSTPENRTHRTDVTPGMAGVRTDVQGTARVGAGFSPRG